MNIAITQKKIAHIIKANPSNGHLNNYDTECGKWISPRDIIGPDNPGYDTLLQCGDYPGGVRMCTRCAKKVNATASDNTNTDSSKLPLRHTAGLRENQWGIDNEHMA